MALINDLELIELQTRHLDAAFALSTEANWNQVIPDWKMMIGAGNAFAIVTPTGRLVATALTLPFGHEFGWISMVLVTKDRRKLGVATHLLNHCIESLESADLVPMLDATPAGENVYRPLGFIPQYRIQRWETDSIETSTFLRAHLKSGRSVDGAVRRPALGEILTLDREIFGGNRSAILRAIYSRCDEIVCAPTEGSGFLLGREGRHAYQIGPVCAYSGDHCVDMLLAALSRLKGPIFIDVPNDKTVLIDLLKNMGFRSQRPFLRMAKSRSKPFGRPGHTFAIAGPELG